ncbi:MAG: hypothetical protein JOY63_10985 [Acetobacteraceae bacterium]|nr:hypothetical protein [Acetobacteraceae bacterium]
MKKIAMLAVLLTALAGGSALAQGLPPGFGNWQSGWPGYANARPSPEMATAKARSDNRQTAARNSRGVPVAGNAQGTHPRS